MHVVLYVAHVTELRGLEPDCRTFVQLAQWDSVVNALAVEHVEPVVSGRLEGPTVAERHLEHLAVVELLNSLDFLTAEHCRYLVTLVDVLHTLWPARCVHHRSLCKAWIRSVEELVGVFLSVKRVLTVCFVHVVEARLTVVVCAIHDKLPDELRGQLERFAHLDIDTVTELLEGFGVAHLVLVIAPEVVLDHLAELGLGRLLHLLVPGIFVLRVVEVLGLRHGLERVGVGPASLRANQRVHLVVLHCVEELISDTDRDVEVVEPFLATLGYAEAPDVGVFTMHY